MLNIEILRQPPAKYRGRPFWAWNGELDRENLRKQISILKDMGFGGFYMHSRVGLETKYLSEEFLDYIKICVKEAKDKGMYACLYDEDRWPSGYGGGAVTKEPKFRATHLLFTRTPYEESYTPDQPDYQPNFAVGVRTDKGKLLAVYDVVLDENGILDSYKVIDKEKPTEGYKWYAYAEENPIHSWYNNGAYVDVLNKKAIDSFIENTHEVYKEKVGEEFGEVIPTIFTDEPHMTYMTNLNEPFDSADQFLPWTDSIEEEAKNRFKISIVERLPELFWEKKEDSQPVRYAFHEVISKLFEEAYSKNIGEWCKKNNLKFTGHYLFEETLFMQNRSAGDLMRMYKHMDIPGMDLLFDEVAITTAKQIQSIVHQYGKEGAMSEEYGGTNWGFEFRDYKFQSDWQACLGITNRVPHLSLMSMKGEAKRDFPPSIFYQVPWYKEYKVLEDYFARQNYLLTQGKPEVKVAVLHPIESYWMTFGPESQTSERRAKMDQEFISLATWLAANQVEFDYLDEALIPEQFTKGKQFGEMEYEVIIIPNLLNVRQTTIDILEKYEGQLVFLKNKPSFSDGHAVENMLASFGNVIDFTEETLFAEVKGYRSVRIIDENENRVNTMLSQTRVVGDDRIIFLAPSMKVENRDHVRMVEGKVFINGLFNVYLINLFTGELQKIKTMKNESETCTSLEYYPDDSMMLYCSKNELSVESEKTIALYKPIEVPDEIDYSLEEDNVVLLDMAEFSVDGQAYHGKEEILRIDEQIRVQLGYRKRNMTMAQPYMYTKPEMYHQVCLRYEIFSKVDLHSISVAMEDMNMNKITWNGVQINEKNGWYIDEAFEIYPLGNLKKGTNILEIELDFYEDTNLEPLYLLGDFGVIVEGPEVQLVARPEKIRYGNVVGQGMDFYGGNIRYEMNVNLPDGKVKIRVPSYRGACVGVEIDGRRVDQYIICSPYEVIVAGLEKGEHTISLILFGNRYNTLSHLHNKDEKSFYRSNPTLWRRKDDMWTYSYNFTSFGIMDKPQIFV